MISATHMSVNLALVILFSCALAETHALGDSRQEAEQQQCTTKECATNTDPTSLLMTRQSVSELSGHHAMKDMELDQTMSAKSMPSPQAFDDAEKMAAEMDGYLIKYSKRWPHCANIKCPGTKTRAEYGRMCKSYGSLCTGFSFTHGYSSNQRGSGCLKKCGATESGGFGTGNSDYWHFKVCSPLHTTGYCDPGSGSTCVSGVCQTATLSCGGHRAASCADCLQGKGAAGCNGDCRWDAGECKSKAISFKFLKFTATKLRDSTSVQISEISFKCRGFVISMDGAVATNPGGLPFPREGPQAAIDGSTDTKWHDARNKPLMIEFSSSVPVDQFTFTTGNDSEGRDPIRWTLQGSNDGTSWIDLHKQVRDFPTTRERHTQQQWFDLTGNTVIG